MQFTEGNFYHIFNRGNDKQRIFFQDRNYLYFIDKVKKYIVPNSNLIAWCLMPNHFHFLIQANLSTLKVVKDTPIKINALTEGIRLLLSSYTKAIQKQESMTGNLFQQKTKFKCADEYLTTAFHYIHQNPLRAGLVKQLENYPWSSFVDYYGVRSGDENNSQICNQSVAYQFMSINQERFLKDSYSVIPDDVIGKIEN
jgi:putative transposase